MNLKEYILIVITNRLYTNIKWFFSLMALHDEGYEDKYILIKDNIYYIKTEQGTVMFDNHNASSPAILLTDKIIMKANEISNLKEDIETSIGLLLINLIRLAIPFNGKISYINKMFTDKDIEKRLPELMKNGTISINEYLAYTDSTSFILPLANLFTYSSTLKTITPPPDMAKKKIEITKEFNTKYGVDWVNDAAKGIEFGNRLKAIDDEYLKDDPSYGKMLSGKVTNNSRPRLYGSFGVEYGFDKTGKNFKFINNSLSEGYPTDRESLSVLFNSARAGSFDRGNETQQGGSLAKDMLRPTSSLQIRNGDCGTILGRKVLITKHTHYRYNGSYILVNNKTKVIENTEDYIDKEVIIRSPLYCKEEGDNFCEYCLNINMKDYKEGLPLLMIEGGGIVLRAKLKSMHKATKKTMYFNILEAIK